jgi:hypothetical protein
MKIAVCLISADRYEYTKATVESFHKFNLGLNLTLLQADDASEDNRVREVGTLHGFEQINKSNGKRLGGQAMRRLAITAAAKRGATHVYILENDIETVRSLPVAFLAYAFTDPEVYCVRLYGLCKERNGQRKCSPYHLGRGKIQPVEWNEYRNEFETAQIGDVHWGAQPCVTRIGEAVWLHADTQRESDIWRKCTKLQAKTVRLLNNVTFHIGDDRTPNFRA